MKSQGLSLSDLHTICKSKKFDVDPYETLAPIMDTFDKDIYGEIPISDFVAQFKGMSIDGVARKHVVQAS